MNGADFKGAVECLESGDHANANKGAVLNNLALCLENLGDLKRARRIQLTAQEIATKNGHLIVQVLSLVNLGSIETKLGNMKIAEQLFSKAIDWIERLRLKYKTFSADDLVATYSDAASYFIQTGQYRRAADCLKRMKPAVGSVFELDRMFGGLVQCEFYVQLGQTSKVRTLLDHLSKSVIFKSDFFEVERILVETRLGTCGPDQTVCLLEHALTVAERLGTRFQHCRILNELATILIANHQKKEAAECARKAHASAKMHGYRVLAAKALLLIGVAAEGDRKKQHWLFGALRDAVEIGVPELVAESAFHVGAFQMATGNYLTAHEYLIKSTSITTDLAEGIPIRLRPAYLTKSWRRDARELVERCNRLLHANSYSFPISVAEAQDRYFKAVYRMTISVKTSKTLESFVTSLGHTLETVVSQPAVITLKDGDTVINRTMKTRLSNELIERIRSMKEKIGNRIYFGSAEKMDTKDTVAWIPLNSQKYNGGIYVTCKYGQSPLSEREMEFLTIVGTIANRALDQLQIRNMEATRAPELTEFHGIIGASKAIREVYSQIEIAAGNSATVLIEGESGTGKELVAKAIHEVSQRAKEPFVAVDCGAIPETLIEAELFGAKKGAYTDAIMDRPGLFEAAHRGTIFLDEISNTSPALQAKLLRVLQERQVRRIGETKDRSIDVRLIVASNANLDRLAQEGGFRKDLLYRLKVLDINLPPLRNRRDDIPMLAHAFLDRLNIANKIKKHFAPGVINQLSMHTFPGNVRELQNAD